MTRVPSQLICRLLWQIVCTIITLQVTQERLLTQLKSVMQWKHTVIGFMTRRCVLALKKHDTLTKTCRNELDGRFPWAEMEVCCRTGRVCERVCVFSDRNLIVSQGLITGQEVKSVCDGRITKQVRDVCCWTGLKPMCVSACFKLELKPEINRKSLRYEKDDLQLRLILTQEVLRSDVCVCKTICCRCIGW